MARSASSYPPLEGEGRLLERKRVQPGWGDFLARGFHSTPNVFTVVQAFDPPPPGEGKEDIQT
jgi:hypothetical protein